MFAIKNENNEYLRYLNPFIFGYNPKKPFSFYKVSKRKTAEGLYAQLLSEGFTNISIVEVDSTSTPKIKKEKSIEKIKSFKNYEILGGEFEDINSEELFDNLHQKCINCSNSCKQSARVKIISC